MSENLRARAIKCPVCGAPKRARCVRGRDGAPRHAAHWERVDEALRAEMVAMYGEAEIESAEHADD